MVLADEPKITDWLSVWFSLGSSVIALLALVAAAIAVRATIQTNRTQTRQLARLEEDRERELAAHFAVWLQPSKKKVFLYYRNAGRLPVYDVRVILRWAKNPSAAEIVRMANSIGPDNDKHPLTTAYFDNGDITEDLEDLAEHGGDSGRHTQHFFTRNTQILVGFRDGNGRCWERAETGVLREIESLDWSTL